jgi:excisionase family DNA binding protein
MRRATERAQEFMDQDAACEFLGITRRTLRLWRAKRQLPAIVVGRVILFRRESLEDFLAAHEQTR